MPILTTLGAACARAWGFTSGLLKDPYFNLTTLLLPGNGTNGAQNNTFLDSSTNNFTITRNGNTTQGTFSPFSQTGWGNYFNGTNAYLRAGTAANWAFLSNTTAAWTIEFWVYNTTSGSSTTLFDTSNSTTANVGVSIQKTSSEYVNVQIVYASAGNFIVNGTSTSTLTANTWNHVFISYNQSLASSNLVFYINGVAAGTANKTANTPSSSNPFGALSIGAYGAGGGQFFTGYLSNVRISNVVRTPPSSVPTSPYTSDADTQLLTCQSNRFVDNSTVSTKTITVNGSPSVQAFSPFNPLLPWTAANNGGSGYFDGSGDYLTVANSNDFDTNTSFTLEAWVYTGGNGCILGRGGGGASWSTSDGHQFIFYVASGVLRWQFNSGGAPVTMDSAAIPLNSWVHCAVGYNGTTTRLWLNGISAATSTSSYTLPTTRNIIRSGVTAAGDQPYTGYISSLRFVKSDVYGVGNTSFTLPTAPLTNIANTSLLLNFTNAGITDATAKNDLETVGNAQISTTQSKWGGGSISFDGTGDYLYSISKPTTSLEGDFTIEFWLYRNVSGNTPIFTLGDSFTANGFEIYIGTSGTQLIVFSGNASRITSSTLPSVTTWAYLAVTRSGSTVTLYLNGTSLGTWSSSSTFSGAVYVGTEFYNGSVNGSLNGYIDDLRITKGYARTVTTTPTAPFPVQ